MVTPPGITRGIKKDVTDFLETEFLPNIIMPENFEFKQGERWTSAISNLYNSIEESNKNDFTHANQRNSR